MWTLYGEVVGALIWVLANLVYTGEVRRGRGGFVRILAFWWGLPGTIASKLLVEEGSQPVIKPPPDDEEALLAEVRRARMKLIEHPEGDDRPGGREEAG
jgi:hypothetical protein